MARTSHQRVNELLSDQSGWITDKGLFAHPAMSSYLTDIANGLLIRNNLKETVTVKVTWEPESEHAGYTNGSRIVINAGHPLYSGDRQERFQIVKGTLLHEVGHILYTDFAGTNKFNLALMNCKFEGYPSDLTEAEKKQVAEMKDYVATVKNQNIQNMIIAVCDQVLNIFEDAYLENCIANEYPGHYAAIYAMRDRKYELLPTLNEIKSAKYDDITGSLSRHNQLLLSYALFAEFKGEEYLIATIPEGEQFLKNMAEIDYILTIEDSKNRLEREIYYLTLLYPYLKPYVEALMEKFGNDPIPTEFIPNITGTTQMPVERVSEGMAASGSSGISPSNCEKENAAGNGSKACLPSGMSSEMPEPCNDGISSKHAEGEVESENTEKRLPFHEHQKNGPEKETEELDHILHKLAQDKALQEDEEELRNQLNSFAATIRHADIHHGITSKIQRDIDPTSRYEKEYEHISGELLRISKRLQGELGKVMEKKRRGGKQTNLYHGTHLEMRAIPRRDGMVFSRTNLPQNKPKIAVMHLIDQSGSMRGERIATAKCTEFILYDFCKALHIAHACYGHSTDRCGSVILDSYVEFNSVDEKDRYRIMGICAGGGNRDGYALRFACERLYQQKADVKLLIITSDGQPADRGYSGECAYEDLAFIRSEYQRKGIYLVAAAIGEDREVIEKIYGSDHFLNVEDLSRLPELLTQLVKKFIKS